MLFFFFCSQCLGLQSEISEILLLKYIPYMLNFPSVHLLMHLLIQLIFIEYSSMPATMLNLKDKGEQYVV